MTKDEEEEEWKTKRIKSFDMAGSKEGENEQSEGKTKEERGMKRQRR